MNASSCKIVLLIIALEIFESCYSSLGGDLPLICIVIYQCFVLLSNRGFAFQIALIDKDHPDKDVCIFIGRDRGNLTDGVTTKRVKRFFDQNFENFSDMVKEAHKSPPILQEGEEQQKSSMLHSFFDLEFIYTT